MARASLLDNPAPATSSLPSSSSGPAPEGSLAELLMLMAVSWRGNSHRVARFAPEADQIMRAMVGYAGGASGGFLIRPEWADRVWDKAREYKGPLSRCILARTNTKEFFLPGFFETSRADGSRYGGVWAQWRGAGTAEVEDLLGRIGSQASMDLVNFQMRRLMIYTAPVSRNLVADTALFEPMMDTCVYNELRYQVEGALLTGSGQAGPQGVVNAPATITIPKDSGQIAGTITTTNIDNCWKSLYGPCRRNACWYANNDVTAALDEVASAGGWPQNVYLPQGVGGNEFPLIKGRPLVAAEQLPGLGTPGDLVLCDFSQYMFCYHVTRENPSGFDVTVGLPGDAVEATASEHVLFDTDSIAFKWKLRADGRLLWPKPITTINGLTVGPACIIAQR
jgi:HK97 family phage major capsid protein